MRRSLVRLALLLPACWAVPLRGADLEPVRRFFQQHCVACHGATVQKGDRRFDQLPESLHGSDELLLLEEALDALQRGVMPPERQGVAPPSDEQRRAVVAELIEWLAAASESERSTGPRLRRLARHEYLYSLRDLLGVPVPALDASRLFPPEPTREGVMTIAAEQSLSEQHLGLFLDAARHALGQALVFGRSRPERRVWEFRPSDLPHTTYLDISIAYRVLDKEQRFIDVGHGEPFDRYPTYPVAFSATGTPVSGRYRITVAASAEGRVNPYPSDSFRCDLSQPMKIGIGYVPEAGLLQPGAAEGRRLAEAFDLADGARREFSVETWMPAGSIPYAHWINGMGSSKPALLKVQREFHPETRALTPVDVDALRARGIEPTPAQITPDVHLSDVYQGPRVRIFGLRLEGPLEEDWPPASHRRLVGSSLDASAIDVPATFEKFARRAFRRGVTSEDVAPYVEYVEDRIRAGVASDEAVTLGLAAILTSPRFLLLEQGERRGDARLSDWELASRLSYLLWSSLPDDELLAAAEGGRLQDPTVLREQAERLLQDERSAAFIHHFAEAWLRLDKLGSMPPGSAQFPTYYSQRLEFAMRRETELFLAHALHENRPVPELLAATYTFVNDALAKHYGLEGVSGEAFRRVELPPEARRGGLLGHASVLTASANGVETSPVVRGAWVLSSLLGSPPPAPPSDVPPLEPDLRGAVTIREQLEQHRQLAACADCHARIDPWGFPLEYFDPIGGLRLRYPIFRGGNRIARRIDGRPVDGAAELPTGETLANEADLRRLLLGRSADFTRALIGKLLVYSSGRELTFEDRPEVERLARQSLESGDGLRDLLHRAIASGVFHRR